MTKPRFKIDLLELLSPTFINTGTDTMRGYPKFGMVGDTILYFTLADHQAELDFLGEIHQEERERPADDDTHNTREQLVKLTMLMTRVLGILKDHISKPGKPTMPDSLYDHVFAFTSGMLITIAQMIECIDRYELWGAQVDPGQFERKCNEYNRENEGQSIPILIERSPKAAQNAMIGAASVLSMVPLLLDAVQCLPWDIASTELIAEIPIHELPVKIVSAMCLFQLDMGIEHGMFVRLEQIEENPKDHVSRIFAHSHVLLKKIIGGVTQETCNEAREEYLKKRITHNVRKIIQDMDKPGDDD